MLAAAATLALFGIVVTLVVDVMRRDGAKVMAALEGRSWTARPTQGRHVTIRFSSADTAAGAVPAQPGLRAAA